ncbi:MAG: hypothetical protein HQL06_09860 [Nitrospirae bacterium]|nr:hypothetical protein [Nitrospirota bacterium]
MEIVQVPAFILIGDIMGSVALADVLPFKEYAEILRQFSDMSYELAEQTKGVDHFDVRGDEVLLIMLCDDNGDQAYKVMNIINFARILKVRWLMSDFNKNRITEQYKRPIDIAIGINYGRVFMNDRGGYEGYSISLAKRVEGTAREYGHYTRIMLSRKAYQKAIKADIKVHWVKPKEVHLKGLALDETVHEILCFYEWMYWNDEIGLNKKEFHLCEKIFINDYSNIWLGIMIAKRCYLNIDFQKAIDILEKVLWVNKNIPVAWVMLGMCYYGKGTINIQHMLRSSKHKDNILEAIEVFYKKAEVAITNAIELERHYDELYIEIGMLYYNWSILIELVLSFNNSLRTQNLEDNLNTLKKQALDAMISAALYGIDKLRCAFWLWVLRGERSYESFKEIGYELGWFKKDISEEDLIYIFIDKTTQYYQMILLPHYRVNVLQCLAFVVRDIFSNKTLKNPFSEDQSNNMVTGLEFALICLEKAKRIASEEIVKGGVYAGIFDTTTNACNNFAYLMPVDDYVKHLDCSISVLNALIPSKSS